MVLVLSHVRGKIMGAVDRVVFISVVSIIIALFDVIIVIHVRAKAFDEFGLIIIALCICAYVAEEVAHLLVVIATCSCSEAKQAQYNRV